jgi:hypothetical protein
LKLFHEFTDLIIISTLNNPKVLPRDAPIASLESLHKVSIFTSLISRKFYHTEHKTQGLPNNSFGVYKTGEGATGENLNDVKLLHGELFTAHIRLSFF